MVFADENGLSIHPKLGRVWAKRGSHPTVEELAWLVSLAKGNTDDFLASLKYLCHQLRNTKVYLYIDGASWHKGDRIREFLKIHLNIEMEYLPQYHPELNVQERVWQLISTKSPSTSITLLLISLNRPFENVNDIGKTGKTVT